MNVTVSGQILCMGTCFSIFSPINYLTWSWILNHAKIYATLSNVKNQCDFNISWNCVTKEFWLIQPIGLVSKIQWHMIVDFVWINLSEITLGVSHISIGEDICDQIQNGCECEFSVKLFLVKNNPERFVNYSSPSRRL